MIFWGVSVVVVVNVHVRFTVWFWWWWWWSIVNSHHHHLYYCYKPQKTVMSVCVARKKTRWKGSLFFITSNIYIFEQQQKLTCAICVHWKFCRCCCCLFLVIESKFLFLIFKFRFIFPVFQNFFFWLIVFILYNCSTIYR